jgi:23S rRNA (uracil1939-C5)-methyltransferase
VNDVLIEKLVVGGMGLGHLDSGMVVLVPHVIPGERVRVQTVKEKKSFQQALLREVLQPSPDRLTPACPSCGPCGGCHFQHIAGPRQDLLKKDIFHEALSRSGLLFAKEKIRYLSSPLRLGYRQRIRLHVHEGQLGFFQPQSHRLLKIEQCLLARPEINAVLQHLIGNEQWLKVAGLVAEVEIHVNPRDGKCVLVTRFNRKPRPRDLASLQGLFADLEGLSSLLVHTPDGALYASFPDQPGQIGYLLCVGKGRCLEIALEPGGFCQVNEGQNQQMVDQLLAWHQDERPGRVLDLFCGVGNFSLPLAAAGFTVTGIDQQRAAIRCARQNCEKNQLVATFRRCAALEGLTALVHEGQTFDSLLLDPPRAGFKEGAPRLTALQASKIIYISCDQATLFRDLQEICGGGYQIAAITLVDQFCQSHHLEAMVLLTRQE